MNAHKNCDDRCYAMIQRRRATCGRRSIASARPTIDCAVRLGLTLTVSALVVIALAACGGTTHTLVAKRVQQPVPTFAVPSMPTTTLAPATIPTTPPPTTAPPPTAPPTTVPPPPSRLPDYYTIDGRPVWRCYGDPSVAPAPPGYHYQQPAGNVCWNLIGGSG